MTERIVFAACCILALSVLLLLAGVCYEQYSRWRLERSALKGKTFVNIHGTPLHYVKKGKGRCTVVFQSGLGSSHYIWKEVQDAVSRHAVTISYDRNGLMFSPPSGKPVTNGNVTSELQALLEKTACPEPYILVGHSMAGIYLRPFIAKHKNSIAGIIFADAAHPLQLEKASPALLKILRIPPRWLIALTVHTGIYRILFSFIPLNPEIPVGHPLHRMEKNHFYRSYKTILEELKNDTRNFRDARQYGHFGDLPLTVITGTSDIRYARIKNAAIREEYRQLTGELQHDLLKLSRNSRFVKAEHSGHIMQVNDAGLLVEEIRRFIC
ncbi:alpha/beta fold hydrolase [Sinomicrobium soli]|uniref:alpha/beta fold hydrolase n=1 Tax=Sinomicrobium sp. N-1-3-6 TaxID=2219864 RepID=UPI000DCDCC91|nr:alpha/beta hydrolase [Sinomicrobium sp. N-1-3-6]RAV29152.1 hypothetical protein DN748_09530 [Sinomicrobium sp. N-1-3-6]